MNFSSKTVENAVQALSGFPGIGKRSALRMVMHLLRRPIEESEILANSILKLKTELQQCNICCNISDTDICEICNSVNRNKRLICIVEDMQDVMAIENTAQFYGLYHVLGGLISPVDGIGPDALSIDQLLKRIQQHPADEIIIALNANIEGDTTSFYLARKLQSFSLKITTISKGIAVGGELEYADEITLGRSITNRIPYGV
ncbi:MAG: recombination protein RecR [Bacteroidetes bacterium]|nr:recombination protein RecR [Bacteroidota bacterium]